MRIDVEGCHRLTLYVVDFYWYFPLDALFQGYEGLCCHHARNALQLVVEQVHELFVVFCKEFHEHGVRACCEMAFHYLWYVRETLAHRFVHAASLQGYDRATFIVTVSADAPEFTPVDIIIIPDPPVGTILSINSTYPLQAVIYPDNASIKSVSWAVSGSDRYGNPLAEIDPYTGVLKTFNSHGDITVTATALDGSGVDGSFIFQIE